MLPLPHILPDFVCVLVDLTFLDVLLHLRAGLYHPDVGGDEGAALGRRHLHLRRGLSEQPPLVGLGFGRGDAAVVERGGGAADLAGDDGAPVGRGQQSRPRPPQGRLWDGLEEGAVMKEGSHCTAAILSLGHKQLA